MTGKTHRVGGVLCVLGGYTILESKGLLLGNVNPILQLAVMYPFSIYGSIASDLDHALESIPSRDIVSLAINKILHLTSGVVDKIGERSTLGKILSIFDAKHRSWQTHSDLVFLLLLFFVLRLFNMDNYSVDFVILRLIGTGFILGLVSHLILDMLTPEGVWFLIGKVIIFGVNLISRLVNKRIKIYKIVPRKISFVPNTKFFRTGGTWEVGVRSVMWVICVLLFFKIIYSVSPYDISFLKG